ncbi:MAG: hypothetical protein ACREBC_35500, partial [Pyrinomonadaceae bacterium]
MNGDICFSAELSNDADLHEAEKQLAAFHSVANKQNLGHNYRAAAQTGILRVEYPDFPANSTYQFMEDGNFFAQEVVAPILSFLQRRRVLIGILRFTSSERLIIAMPPFLAGEWIDSVAFGPETIDSGDLEQTLVTSLTTYQALANDKKNRIRMLLLRYNELLNLPYVHERVEGLWRIIESLGRLVPPPSKLEGEYKRLLSICGAKQSENLKLLLAALLHYGMTYSDIEVKESREFRNHTTHEYLDSALVSWPSISNCFSFLHRCVDRAI